MFLVENGPNVEHAIPPECKSFFGLLIPAKVVDYNQPKDGGQSGELSISSSEGVVTLPSIDWLL
jgi:hypothetical protein